jgi:hypothetical protein
MSRTKCFVLLLLMGAGPAWGQSDDDYARYARPVIDKFTACERPKITKWARTTQDAPEALADRAVEECKKYLDELSTVMQSKPFYLSATEAQRAIDEMLVNLRSAMLDDIKKVRS